MSQSNFTSLNNSDTQLTNTKEKDACSWTQSRYRQPQVYSLGNIEKVQANSYGEYYDGPNTEYLRW